MKLRWIVTSAILAYSSLSQAGFVFQLDSGSCSAIAGHWSGQGKASNWLIGECSYHGEGLVGVVDEAGRFSINVTASKDSGNSLCPKHTTKQLSAVCKNGLVTIKTEFGNLKGSFSETTGYAAGTLSVAPGLEADVSMNFSRQG